MIYERPRIYEKKQKIISIAGDYHALITLSNAFILTTVSPQTNYWGCLCFVLLEIIILARILGLLSAFGK